MVYSTLALALLAGSALRAALVMIAFGLGTLPNLAAAALAARRVALALRRNWVRILAGALIMALGLVGFARIPGLADSIREGLACLG
ncbi:MAG: sulfite exporter TauE/SafE family protein [Betaproteobacteria bacterium]|nr:sulfite exporter TauE/SafE family protein [Betaproteobacteria bacterium]